MADQKRTRSRKRRSRDYLHFPEVKGKIVERVEIDPEVRLGHPSRRRPAGRGLFVERLIDPIKSCHRSTTPSYSRSSHF